MNSKERVIKTFARERPDRVPIDYAANAGIDARLKAHFGLAPDDCEGLLRALGVDFRPTSAPYIGPRLHAEKPGIAIDPEFGIHTKWIEHETGGYMDYCDFPLSDADEATVEAWPMPSPDDYDYDAVVAACERHKDYACYVGHPGLGDIINSTGMLRTMERVFMDLITEDPAGMRLIDRKLDVQFEVTRRTLEKARGNIDFVWIGEDLGTQHAPIIGMDIFRAQIRPRHQRLIDLAKAHGLPVMIHTCGSSSWAYEDFIEMGIDVVDTLQPEATNMSPQWLVEHFGGRLGFHGCISTAGPVAYGTVEDVVADCRRTLDVMMPAGGYSFAPTHALQDNSPTENVVAMYETAQRDGRY